MPEPSKTHYGIVGAGIAGIAAAEAIREIDPERDLLLVNGEQVQPYCRPLIVEVLKGEREFDEIQLRDPQWFKQKNISLITGDPAVALRATENRLELESGRIIEWKKLLIATGSIPSTPPIKGLEDIPAFTLYRLEDVERLKPLCKPGAKVLLIGIGLIGLQAIIAMKELGVEVIAVELMPKVLPVILEARAAEYAQKRLEENGIKVHVGTSVKQLMTGDTDHPYVALIDCGKEIGFDFLVLATGMKPDFSLLNGSGIETDRGIKVSPEMQTSVPGIYAAGDITQYSNWIEGRPEIHAHWVNAYRQGRIAGLRMAGGDAEPYEPVYLNSLSVFGLPVITIGASRIDEPEGADVYISESPARPAYTRFVVKNGRLIAATFINDVDRSGVFQYLVREKIDIGDVAQSLFEEGLQGMEFLYKLHDEVVKGDMEWPKSMDLIDRFRKDHKHTRWGKKESSEKREP